MADQDEAVLAEQVRQIVIGFLVDGHAKRMQTFAARLQQRHPGILDPIPALIMVQIIRLPIRQQQQQAAGGGLRFQYTGGIARRRAHPGVIARLDGVDAPPDYRVIPFPEALDALYPDVLALAR